MRALFAAFVLALLIVTGCSGADQSPTPLVIQSTRPSVTPTTLTATSPSATMPEREGPLRGVALSPRGMNAIDFRSFVEQAAASLDLVAWAGDWLELTRPDDGGPTVVATLGKEYGFLPLAELSVHHDGDLVHPLDATTRQLLVQSAAAYVSMWHPKYLGIGIEVNTLYELHPDDFDDFVAAFDETAAAVRAASPGTKVFVCFQLEKMKGYTLWLNDPPDPNKAEWDLIDRFDADLIAFTTYPDLVFKDPSEIPDDYYTSITDRVDKPVIFTEIGWQAAASPAGWESSDEEQAVFLAKFMDLSAPLDCDLLIWSFMYDQPTFEPFDTMGLYRTDGSARPAAALWLRP